MTFSDGSGVPVHGRNRGPKKFFPAICHDCGTRCVVPFDPTGGIARCRDCFEKHKAEKEKS
ncbi:MAG TPA: hypothetical protein VI874_01880 [Candidatus Norongarragalinales archaeon]|nr:hypothetical protein [Candidatus Norongarragalinales archaeon]